jgi:hypothetical protein
MQPGRSHHRLTKHRCLRGQYAGPHEGQGLEIRSAVTRGQRREQTRVVAVVFSETRAKSHLLLPKVLIPSGQYDFGRNLKQIRSPCNQAS